MITIPNVAQGRRLKAARIAAGYRSAREAALENEWPESSYRAHENGTRTIGQDDAERYVRVFRARGARITAQQIQYGDGRDTAEASAITFVPLYPDFVSAGRLLEPGHQIP